MITEYKVGDKLYEGTHESEGLRRTPIVREWEVLAVTLDPRWQNTDGTPLYVVTMRADVKRSHGKDPAYRALSAELVDVDVTHGTWRRTRADAERMMESWAGWKEKGATR